MERGELYETGMEPEFFVRQIAKVEAVSGDVVRLYVASHRQNHLKLEYTVLVPLADLAEIGRECLRIVSDLHDAIMRSGPLALQ